MCLQQASTFAKYHVTEYVQQLSYNHETLPLYLQNINEAQFPHVIDTLLSVKGPWKYLSTQYRIQLYYLN